MSDEKTVGATEITWRLTPLPRFELLPAADLMKLDFGDLLEYTFDLQNDVIAVRAVLHESVNFNASLNHQLDRALRAIRDMRAAR
jgi:hypothetical protein